MENHQRGQSLVLIAILVLFLLLPMAALAIDLPSMWMSRRELQKLADAACLAGALAAENDPTGIEAAILQSFSENGVDPLYYYPQEGTGTSLGKGYEWTSGGEVRVALWGPTKVWFSHFIPGVDGWEVGARAHCRQGLGGFLPLALKESEMPGTRILQTPDPNDEWSGPCSDQATNRAISDPLLRDPENCWVWGDWQILAGDGHVPNEGTISMNGLIAPDVRCIGLNELCEVKSYLPPAPEDAAVNKLKDLTMDYILGGGYPGWLPIPGAYDDPYHSPLIAQMEGVSNNFLTQSIEERYDVGDFLVVFVYNDGIVLPATKNFEYVEVIGFAVVQLVYTDANTVVVVPEYPAAGSLASWNEEIGLSGILPKTKAELGEAGYALHALLLAWE
ncbi:MAG: pilus assembly protein TadG-related protein [Anaerolineales bacterium]